MAWGSISQSFNAFVCCSDHNILRLSGTWLFSWSNASVTSPNDCWALLSFLLSTNASHMSAQQVNPTRTFVHSRIQTILRKLLSLIWKSSNSCRCGVAIPLADGDIIFSKDQRVSIISPSTLPAPGITFRAYCQKWFLRWTPMKQNQVEERTQVWSVWGRWLKLVCFALMNTSPQISEDRVPTVSRGAEGQW